MGSRWSGHVIPGTAFAAILERSREIWVSLLLSSLRSTVSMRADAPIRRIWFWASATEGWWSNLRAPSLPSAADSISHREPISSS